MQGFVGIDVSKEKLDVFLILESKTRKKVIENSERGFKNLYSWLSKLQLGASNTHICMEATGVYFEGVADFFHSLHFKVSVVNPWQIRAFRNSKLVRQKTDPVDAQIIAEFCKQNNPAQWTPRTPEMRELHTINHRINFLKKELNREQNQLEDKKLNPLVLRNVKKHIRLIEKSIEELEEEARKLVESTPDLKQKFDLLVEIQGVGKRTALTIIADMPDIKNFKTAGQFAAFVGVTPSHFQSGSSVNGKSHLSKVGSRAIRKVLYMCAISVKNHNPYFRNFVRRLESRGKKAMVILGAIMRKLMVIFFGMLKNLASFDENLAFKI